MPDLISMTYSPGRTGEIPYTWQDDAACANADPDLFFPEAGEWLIGQRAKEICSTCPVVQQCAQLGMKYEHGIFGGMNPAERGTRRSKKTPVKKAVSDLRPGSK